MKYFNTTGICIPSQHYMADVSKKMEQIETLIHQGNYFTINRIRQYGKTTMLSLLEEYLKEKYYVINISFEGVGDEYFSSEAEFVRGFIHSVEEIMEYTPEISELSGIWMKDTEELTHMYGLSKHISEFCVECDKRVLLMIDEVDKNNDNQMFLSFLGMLRNKYLQRIKIPTFHSVILTGVYHVKNFNLKLQQEEEHKYNVPWNVAADFTVNMAFSISEIESMLLEYEQEHHTGMNRQSIAEEIYYYTSGHPFLVSYISRKIDERKQASKGKNKSWSRQDVRYAIRDILKGTNPLFDDLVKTLENNKVFFQLIKDMLLSGKNISFNALEPVMNFGINFGVFKDNNGRLAVSNLIFEECLYNYIIAKQVVQGAIIKNNQENFVENGHLNMKKILNRFQELMKEEYRNENKEFLEHHGRLLFLCFIKPVINKIGHYIVEPSTRDDNRMNLVIFYGEDKFIVELKLWYNQKYNEKRLEAFADFMNGKHQKKGYLITFYFYNGREKLHEDYTQEFHQYKGKEIYEVVV